MSAIVGVLLSVMGSWSVSPELAITSAVLFVTLGFVLVLIIVGYVVSRWKKGSPQVAHLKDRLESAFSDALDQSPLNPRRASADHRA
jgi:vacuolar-type H+-ATPase subunit I/STV1